MGIKLLQGRIFTNDEAITVPADYVLVQTQHWRDLDKFFAWGLKVLSELELDPHKKEDRPLIYLRAEFRDQVFYNEKRPESLATSHIWWSTDE